MILLLFASVLYAATAPGVPSGPVSPTPISPSGGGSGSGGGGGSGELSNIADALTEMCELAQVVLGISIASMILLSGATYAAGQLMGAETRARATVWATAMITGAVIGALIYFIVPLVLNIIFAGGGQFDLANPCNFRPAGS